MKNIVLIGMPGCGKTTLGRYLAEILNRDFIDLDKLTQLFLGGIIERIFCSAVENCPTPSDGAIK